MFIYILLLIPSIGLLLVVSTASYKELALSNISNNEVNTNYYSICKNNNNHTYLKTVVLQVSVLTMLVSLFIFGFYDFSSNQFQFVQEYHEISTFNLYLGVDGLSIYFVLLTTIIMPISLLSN